MDLLFELLFIFTNHVIGFIAYLVVDLLNIKYLSN